MFALPRPRRSVEGILKLGQLLVEVGGLAGVLQCSIGIHVRIQVQVVLEVVLSILDALHIPVKLRQETNRCLAMGRHLVLQPMTLVESVADGWWLA